MAIAAPRLWRPERAPPPDLDYTRYAGLLRPVVTACSSSPAEERTALLLRPQFVKSAKALAASEGRDSELEGGYGASESESESHEGSTTDDSPWPGDGPAAEEAVAMVEAAMAAARRAEAGAQLREDRTPDDSGAGQCGSPSSTVGSRARAPHRKVPVEAVLDLAPHAVLADHLRNGDDR